VVSNTRLACTPSRKATLLGYRSSKQRCHALETVLDDALQYDLPEGPIVCFIFNAMDRATTKGLMDRVDKDLGSRSAPAFVIYENKRDVMEMADAFSSVKKLHCWKRSPKFLIFANATAGQHLCSRA
jgi:hypothetical protein